MFWRYSLTKKIIKNLGQRNKCLSHIYFHISIKEENKYTNIIKQYRKWLTVIIHKRMHRGK